MSIEVYMLCEQIRIQSNHPLFITAINLLLCEHSPVVCTSAFVDPTQTSGQIQHLLCAQHTQHQHTAWRQGHLAPCVLLLLLVVVMVATRGDAAPL